MKVQSEKLLRWSFLLSGIALNMIDSFSTLFFKAFNNGVTPDRWSNLIDQISPYKEGFGISLLLLALILWVLHYKNSISKFYQRFFLRSDVWIYDAAHFLVSGRWDEPQIVGYGVDVARLTRDGTTLYRTEVNSQSGVQSLIPYTPQEEALAIRNTRLENVNQALEAIRLIAQKDLPIWTLFNDSGKRALISNEYWVNYRFEIISDLKQASAPSLKTTIAHQGIDANRPYYHSLKTNKKLIEMIWPKSEKPRPLYGSIDFQKFRRK